MRAAYIAILTVMLSACVVDMDLMGGLWKVSDEYHIQNYSRVTIKNGEDFTIMQLTDTHIGAWINDEHDAVQRTFDLIERAVHDHKPDMVVLTGDNIIATGVVNTIWAQSLVSFLDGFKIPYALVMGNHDGGGFFDMRNDNRQDIVADIFASGTYSLFQKGPENVYGKGNYGIHIVNEGGDVVYSAILLDSNRDYFRENQVDWYRWYVKGISDAVYGMYDPDKGKVVKSIVFFHIPLQEIHAVKETLAAEDPEQAAISFWENPSAQTENTGMFTAMKELKSTTHIFFGHDHVNKLLYEYQGIHFAYGLKTGYCAYYNKERVGVSVITITEDGTITVAFKHY